MSKLKQRKPPEAGVVIGTEVKVGDLVYVSAFPKFLGVVEEVAIDGRPTIRPHESVVFETCRYDEDADCWDFDYELVNRLLVEAGSEESEESDN